MLRLTTRQDYEGVLIGLRRGAENCKLPHVLKCAAPYEGPLLRKRSIGNKRGACHGHIQKWLSTGSCELYATHRSGPSPKHCNSHLERQPHGAGVSVNHCASFWKYASSIRLSPSQRPLPCQCDLQALERVEPRSGFQPVLETVL